MELKKWLWKYFNVLTTQIVRSKPCRVSMPSANNYLPVTTLWVFRINSSSQKWMKVLIRRERMWIQILLGRSILCSKWSWRKEICKIFFSINLIKTRTFLQKMLRNYLRFRCLMLWTCCIKSSLPMEISQHNTS